jgi:hypothetical protein
MSWCFGLGFGQKTRIVFRRRNLVTTTSFDVTRLNQAELKLFDLEGNQIMHRETIVPQNGFSIMEVDRDEISLRGESTGRLQMLAKVFLVQDNAGSSDAPPLVNPEQWLPDVSVEVIKKSTGETVTFISAVHTDPPILDLFKNDFVFGVELPSFGLIHGQEGRFSLLNTDSGRPLSAVVKIFDAEGNLVTQREMVVPANGFNYVKISREDFSQPGESATGRLQLQGTFTLTFNGQTTVGSPRLIPGSLEIVQDGETVAIGLLLPIVQRERCTLPTAQCP